MEMLVEAQGGDPRVVARPDLLPAAPVVRTVAAHADGWVAEAEARGIAEAALQLGAGRLRKGDPVDPAVGVVVLARVGDRLAPGAPLAEVHARTDAAAEAAEGRLRDAFRLSPEAVPAHAEPYETVG
jgi:thymidine phosphorylase